MEIPVKLPLLSLIILMICSIIINNKKIRLNKNLALFSILFSGVIFLWAIIGYGYNIELTYVTQEAMLLLTIPIILLSTNILISSNIINVDDLCKHFINASLCYALIKILIEMAYWFQLIDMSFINYATKSIFGTSIMLFPIGEGLTRLYMINDLTTLYTCINIFAFKDRLLNPNSWVNSVSIFILLISIFLSFSRAIWAVLLLLSILSLMVTKKWKDVLVYSGIALITLIILSGTFQDDIANRTSADSSMNEQSDQVRIIQYDDLLESFQSNMVIGNGVGSYIVSNISSQAAPFSYELQVLSFMMKFGIVGCVLLLMSLYLYLKSLFSCDQRRNAFLIMQPISIIVLSFTNPYLTSSVMAGILSFLFAVSKNIAEPNK